MQFLFQELSLLFDFHELAWLPRLNTHMDIFIHGKVLGRFQVLIFSI